MTTSLLIVTGASRGLGRSIALAFVRQFCCSKRETATTADTTAATTTTEWKIWLIARDLQGMKVTRQMIYDVIETEGFKSNNTSILVEVDCHVIDLSQMEHLSDRIESLLLQHKTTTTTTTTELYFINNAGSIGPIRPCHTLSLQDMQSTFYFNITSACWLSARFVQWALQQQQQQQQQHSNQTTVIVNISSLVAIQAFPSLSLYSAGKAARDSFHSALAQEQPAIQVLNYAPGPLETDMTTQLRQAPLLDSSLQPQYQQQLIDPNDSAAKLVDILFYNKFKSGQHVDYYDNV